jgi:hypothetical protein
VNGGTGVLSFHRFNVSPGLRMITARHHQPRVGHGRRDAFESFDHQLQPLVSSPFAECQNAVLRISPPRKPRILRPAGKNSVGAQVNVLVPVFIQENFAVARHQHGNRMREQQHARGNRTRPTIGALVANAGVIEIDRVHQVVQSHMSVAAVQTRQQRRQKPQKSVQRLAPESAEQQVEPYYVRLEFTYDLDQPNRASGIVK